MDNLLKNRYRRNLVDMHIEDWSPEFLSKFSIDKYYDNIVRAKIQSSMVYLQSHVGYCNWPTETGVMHSAFKGKEDTIKKLIDRLRSSGIAVIGYYSLIYNTWAEKTHPEWRIIMENGKTQYEEGTRYGLCCPNNMGYRDFVYKQIKEITEYFNLDGIFYDMTFWPHVCHCDSCKALWEKEEKCGFPKEDWNDEKWLRFVKRRQEWITDFAAYVTKITKTFKLDYLVGHNYAGVTAADWIAATSESINDVCDYTGGDLYGDLYNHSYTCKYYKEITKSHPFEYMTCRVDNRLYQHTVTKEEEHLKREVLLTTAHGGASLIIDAIDPDGSMDDRVYDRIGKVFDTVIPYEKYLGDTEIFADAGVLFDPTAKHDDKSINYSNNLCSINTVKTLIKAHIPVRMITRSTYDKYDSCKVIVASDIKRVNTKIKEKLFEYVNNGGCLYISGILDDYTADFLGVKLKEITEESETYIVPDDSSGGIFNTFNKKYPLHTYYRQQFVVPDNAEILAYIGRTYTLPKDRKFASIHSNPPGKTESYPSIIIVNKGKGKVLWSAAPIENEERIAYRKIFVNLLNYLYGKELSSVSTSAGANTEIVIMSAKDGALLSCVNIDLENKAQKDFYIKLRLPFIPQSIQILPDGKKQVFKQYDGITRIDINGFDDFLMIKINK